MIHSLFTSCLFAFTLFAAPHNGAAPPEHKPPAIIAQPRPPAIFIPNKAGQQAPAQIQSLKIEVQVVGALATTTWDMTVYNPQSRVLEGELVFPLGEGQSVSRFAMEVNGALREGVVVEKAKGRQVFESTVRRGIDPGLLERVAGNSFKARIYPIPAKGAKRVVIAYEQELPFVSLKEGNALRYTLPMGFERPIGRFSLSVEVLQPSEQPRFTSSPLQNFELKPWRRNFKAEAVRENFKPDAALTLLVPQSPEASGAFVQRIGNERYFYVSLTPNAPREARPLPKRLLIAWDASASASGRDQSKELDLLDHYFKSIGTCTVELVLFRNVPEPPRLFTVKEGDWKAIKEAISSAPSDGATAFGALDLSDKAKGNAAKGGSKGQPKSASSGARCDVALLFSDGINTLGQANPKLPQCPLMAINTALTAEHDTLRAWAEPTGGEYLNLSTQSAEQGLESLKTEPLALLKTTYEPGAVQELYPSGGALVRGSFGLAGKLSKEHVQMTLHFGYGQDERFTRVVDVGEEDNTSAPVARMWAQKKLQQLMLEPEVNRTALLQLGQAFSIVTPNTSLIVLDALADYVQFRIVPPADMQEEYFRLVGAQERIKSEDERSHLESVFEQFKERQSWWEKEFKPAPLQPKDPAALKAKRPRADSANVSAAETGMTMSHDYMERIAVAQSLNNISASPAAPSHTAPSPKKERNTPDTESTSQGTILLKNWNPDTPYLKILEQTAKDDRYATYLKLRPEYGSTPGFFLDVSDLFFKAGEGPLALRILSNLAELKLEEATLLRVLGYRLGQLGEHRLSVWAFEKVLRLREEEPQSSRDLALAYAAAGQKQRAADLLWSVVKRHWDGRLRDINLIALGELNALIGTAKSKINTADMDPRLLRNLPVDVRVVLNWDTDNSDMDLHIFDPRGEECSYSHKATELGGRISSDVTGGYGPEEFLLKQAIPGTYKVRAKYFGTRQQSLIGATTVSLELYLHYASGKVENKSALLRLTGDGRMVDVGEFVFVK